jgi:hypothetical protein
VGGGGGRFVQKADHEADERPLEQFAEDVPPAPQAQLYMACAVQPASLSAAPLVRREESGAKATQGVVDFTVGYLIPICSRYVL